jgi:hypothetical protein
MVFRTTHRIPILSIERIALSVRIRRITVAYRGRRRVPKLLRCGGPAYRFESKDLVLPHLLLLVLKGGSPGFDERIIDLSGNFSGKHWLGGCRPRDRLLPGLQHLF